MLPDISDLDNENLELSLGSDLVFMVLLKGSNKGLVEVLHLGDGLSKNVLVKAGSDLHEGTDGVIFTDLAQLDQSLGHGLGDKGVELGDDHLKGLDCGLGGLNSDKVVLVVLSTVGPDDSFLLSEDPQLFLVVRDGLGKSRDLCAVGSNIRDGVADVGLSIFDSQFESGDLEFAFSFTLSL